MNKCRFQVVPLHRKLCAWWITEAIFHCNVAKFSITKYAENLWQSTLWQWMGGGVVGFNFAPNRFYGLIKFFGFFFFGIFFPLHCSFWLHLLRLKEFNFKQLFIECRSFLGFVCFLETKLMCSFYVVPEAKSLEWRHTKLKIPLTQNALHQNGIYVRFYEWNEHDFGS